MASRLPWQTVNFRRKMITQRVLNVGLRYTEMDYNLLKFHQRTINDPIYSGIYLDFMSIPKKKEMVAGNVHCVVATGRVSNDDQAGNMFQNVKGKGQKKEA